MKVYELTEDELAEIEDAAFAGGMGAAADFLTGFAAEARERGMGSDVAVLNAAVAGVRGIVSLVATPKATP